MTTPIGGYGFLSDGRASALVSDAGSVDWCCLPAYDSDPVFARLLGGERGGHSTIEAPEGLVSTSRSYVDDTLLLATELRTPTGSARVVDCLVRPAAPDDVSAELVRTVHVVEGSPRLRAVVRPRFDFGTLEPELVRRNQHVCTAVGGDDALVVWSDTDLEVAGAEIVGPIRPDGDRRWRLSIHWMRPEDLERTDLAVHRRPEELDEAVDRTRRWWLDWSARSRPPHAFGPEVRRSALVLKGLVYEPTGAIAAAPTTSLPEAPGGERNWDYRFSWIRDSQFTVRTLSEIGHREEADAFHRFLRRSTAGSAESLQVLYGVTGRRRLEEHTVPLEGYLDSTPVRAGNQAAGQHQHDVFGYVLELAWRHYGEEGPPSSHDWRFLTGIVEETVSRWREPDAGIWEVRHAPQHFVHSKVMCWTALDRAIRLVERFGLDAPVDRWREERTEIRRVVDDQGFDEDRGTFVRALGGHDLDAALLLLPTVGFIDAGDLRMVSTVDAVRAGLDDQGLLRRYRSDDGLGGHEGAFLPCTFWLVECLAAQGRTDEALAAYRRALGLANDLGLFSEEGDPDGGRLLGNFPQGLTHLSHIAAALALQRAGPAVEPGG